MTDALRSLVEMLREHDCFNNEEQSIRHPDDTIDAADHIEALEREVAELKEAVKACGDENEALETEATDTAEALTLARAQVREQAAKVAEGNAESEYHEAGLLWRKEGEGRHKHAGDVASEIAAAIRAMPLEG